MNGKDFREIPGHQALGPQGEQVAALIERAKTISDPEAKSLAAAGVWAAARDAAWAAAYAAAWDAARAAARDTARDGDAAWAAAWSAARDGSGAGVAAWDAAGAARALVVRDRLDTESYELLTIHWRRVIGSIHPEDK